MTLRQRAGVAMAVVAAFILFTTFPGRISHRILVPGLVPVFGIPFLVLFALGQAGLCFALKAKKGLYWMAGGLVLGSLLALLGYYALWSNMASTEATELLPRNAVCAAVCLSAVSLGFALWKEKV